MVFGLRCQIRWFSINRDLSPFLSGLCSIGVRPFDTCLECHNNKVVAPTSCPCNNLAVICVTQMVNVRAGQPETVPNWEHWESVDACVEMHQKHYTTSCSWSGDNPQANQWVVSVPVVCKQWAAVVLLMPFLGKTASLHKRVSSSPWTRVFQETILEVAECY